MRSRRFEQFALALTLVTACTSARERADTDIVRSIRFRGNHGGLFSDKSDWALREQMAQRESPGGATRWPTKFLREGEAYQPTWLDGDSVALQVYLAHNGWFDAELGPWDARVRRRSTRKKVAVVDLRARVAPGPTTRFAPQSPAIAWGDAPVASEGARELRRRCEIVSGTRFRLDQVQRCEDRMLRYLREAGFAYADVRTSIEVHPEQYEARVRFDVSSGPVVRLGEVRVEGLEHVPEDRLRAVMDLALGERYAPTRLEESEATLMALGAFERVEARPDLSVGGREVVPVALTVQEAPPHRLDLSVGASHVAGRLAPELAVSYANHNAEQQLKDVVTRFVLDASYTVSTPLAHVEHERTIPGFHGTQWTRRLHLYGGTDLWESALLEGRFELGDAWERPVGGGWRAGAGGDLRAHVIDAGADPYAKALLDVAFGVSEQHPAVALGVAHASISHERVRGGTFGPREGHRVAVEGQVAMPVLSTNTFVGAGATAAVYAQARPLERLARVPTEIGVRAQLRAEAPVLGSSVPYPERYFLGGSASLRGFRSGGVGAYDCVCVPKRGLSPEAIESERDVFRRYVPQGGLTSGIVTVEAQLFDVGMPGLVFATFAEAGAVGATPAALLQPRSWRADVGVGARYRTPIGPLRVDLALRPIYPEDDGPQGFGSDPWGDGAYYGCDAVGARRRAFDLISEFQRTGPLGRRPVAVNLMLGIGDAF